MPPTDFIRSTNRGKLSDDESEISDEEETHPDSTFHGVFLLGWCEMAAALRGEVGSSPARGTYGKHILLKDADFYDIMQTALRVVIQDVLGSPTAGPRW